MKKGLLLFGMLLLILASISAQSLSSVLNWDITLKTIALAVQSGDTTVLQDGRSLLISGIVSRIRVIDANPETYSVEIELLQGEWEGTTQIRIYTCLIRFGGTEFSDRFPQTREQRQAAPPDAVVLNNKVILAARYTGTTQGAEGPVAVLNGLFIRVVQ